MIKIKNKEVAELIGCSEQYTRMLLSKLKIKLRQENLADVIDFIAKRRVFKPKSYVPRDKKELKRKLGIIEE